MITKLLTLFIVLITMGCEKENRSFSTSNQEIFFQCDYVNYAWGHQHSGWMIDSSGIVKGYHLPKVWNYVDSSGCISEIKMKENIGQLDTLFTTVEKDTLSRYVAKIFEASNGAITEPKSVMADAGSTVFSAFLYDSGSKTYRQVLLKQTGDWFIDNKSAAANEIYNWMTKIRENILLTR